MFLLLSLLLTLGDVTQANLSDQFGMMSIILILVFSAVSNTS